MNRVVVPATPVGPLPDAWRHCVGTGRLNLALRADYRESLALVQRDIGFRHIRGHGLLSDDMGVLRPWTHEGRAGVRHAFTYVDQVHDAFLSLGIRPFVELGFMPTALASGDDTVFWWKGNITPPSSWTGWADLVSGLVRHLVDRYGIEEVRTWPIEVWNEPNLTVFWKDADQAAYLQLYEVTARAVKEVDASLQVGGPAISPGAGDWWEPFADFVAAREVPCDFLSVHAYASGPAQDVPFGTYQTLKPPQDLLDQFAAPRRLLAGRALADLPVHVTEFNTSYRPDNPVHDTAYNAAYLAPVLAGGGDHVDSFSYWTFSDVFEETWIPTSFFHGGFGLLTHRQVPKPTYHLYAFLARMGAHVLARGDDHLVCADDDGRVTVLAWQPVGGTDGAPADARHELRLSVPVGGPAPAAGGGGAVPATAFVVRERVNEHEGNAFAAWRELGRPFSPTERQVDLLRDLARPSVAHAAYPVVDGRVSLDLSLARHEVTFVEVTPVVPTLHEGLDDRRLLGVDDDRLLADPPGTGRAVALLSGARAHADTGAAALPTPRTSDDGPAG
ncbi:GH39 family glycosyl hydrolase [Cellulomonas fimi]|uniref:Xylan 1,4-beta-xylosidase n=1 Tax=Cellulomonas fimi (strain ATCC 484 / DSM 20113 / JCM 1341 / CCUG 24087 / LMG 16345 / NBRC 15513 / NCIMB 8980 / NCTC 7547 / NRS-133) TaxID=590998 RepID=F4H115_CELFA|nr:xylan 1,4-beta-xylosidase [Cellulomonas fimi]AEE47384.1 Xylan 1,4-beta-xylosidase [Cellulomonas fimi ATCC 484]NNH05786.1 xylan 1,4-beta-xylosidase [Cellulomonas fimi]VEH36073.1 Beta-xylosidase [Cellulomonas fimi]